MRVRITVAAVLVVGAVLALGGAWIVHAHHAGLIHDNDAIGDALARDVAAEVAHGTVTHTLREPRRGDTLVQVVDDRGNVLAASPNIEQLGPITTLDPGREGLVARTFDHLPVGDDPFRVVARAVRANGVRYTVYVARGLESVQRSTDRLIRLLAIALPILLALMATMIWVVVGRALRPVEAIRAEVDSIGGRDLHRRVPEPGAHDEIGRLARTMNMMLARLESAADGQRRFVADASHELRSPLAGMRTQLEVDLAHPERADWQDTERTALDNTIRLQRLVDDLLVLAQHGSSGVARREAVDLDDVVLAEARRLRSTTTHAVDTTGVSGAQLVGDAGQLSRAVRNLLDNAERYAASTITIELAEVDHTIVLTISDDGPGIPAEEQARVFERFARLDDARADGSGGAGLGLAITHDVVTAHGGTIQVTNRPGASFTLQFPVPPDDSSHF